MGALAIGARQDITHELQIPYRELLVESCGLENTENMRIAENTGNPETID